MGTFFKDLLLFSGYGHISPSDVNGQIACVLYTTLGLPIILIFLGKIGVVMAKSLKYIYSRGCCRWCRARRKLTEFLVKKEAKLDFQLKDEEVGQEEYMPTDFVRFPIFSSFHDLNGCKLDCSSNCGYFGRDGNLPHHRCCHLSVMGRMVHLRFILLCFCYFDHLRIWGHGSWTVSFVL